MANTTDIAAPAPGALARCGTAITTFDELLTTTVNALSPGDIALNNLVCATGLPGAAETSIPKYLRRLDALIDFVRRESACDLSRFRNEPRRYCEFAGRSEAFFRIASMVTILKRDCGLRYNPDMTGGGENSCRLGFMDCGDLLISGLLDDRRTGTCNSIPVLLVAVGRRLGYPLFVSANRHHVFARWDGAGPGSPGIERFNIEASNGGGMDSPDDDHYRSFPYPMETWERAAGYYLGNFTPADELALAMFSRAWVLATHGRFEESMLAAAKCCFLAPSEPAYPRMAFDVVLDALYLRKTGRYMVRRGRERHPVDGTAYFDPREVFPPKQAATACSIRGHFSEVRGEPGNALLAYQGACALDADNSDYASDLARFRREIPTASVQSAVRANEVYGKRPGLAATGGPPVASSAGGKPAHAPTGAKPRSGSDALLRLIATPSRLMNQSKGLAAERAGRFAEAQALYACAAADADPNGPQAGRAYLQRAVRKELLEGHAPVAFATAAPDETEAHDPRLGLSGPLQAVIWAERGRALEGLGRFNDAVLAYLQAQRLAPTNPRYPLDVHRAASRETAAKRARFDTITVAQPISGAVVWSPQFQVAARWRPPDGAGAPRTIIRR